MFLSKLISSKKEESESVEQYLKEVKDIIDQLHDNARAIPMDMIILLVRNPYPRNLIYSKESFQEADHDSLTDSRGRSRRHTQHQRSDNKQQSETKQDSSTRKGRH